MMRRTRPSTDSVSMLEVEDDEPNMWVNDDSNSSPLISMRNIIPGLGEDLLKLQKLGKGQSSKVFMAVHIRTLKVVALKEIDVQSSADRDTVRSELKALKTQRSPLMDNSFLSNGEACEYIVKFYGSAVVRETTAILAVEFIAGGCLQAWIDCRTCSPDSWLADISFQILVALNFLHKHGRTHRDVKPANVLITREGSIKLVDFGCAGDDMVQKMNGTRQYMAPERLKGDDVVPKSDVWSFGLTIAAAALSECPVKQSHSEFEQMQEAEHVKDIIQQSQQLSVELKSFLCSCLEVELDQRSSISQLLKHPFLKNRFDWPTKCPGVLKSIELNQFHAYISTEEMAAEIGMARDAYNLENRNIPLHMLSSLARAFDTTEYKLQSAFTDYADGNFIPSHSNHKFTSGNSNRWSNHSTVSKQWHHSNANSPFSSNHSTKKAALSKDLSYSTPHVTQFRSNSYNLTDEYACLVAERMKQCLEVRDRFYRMKLYRLCFVGSTAVKWMVQSKMASSIEHAVELGNKMVILNILFHVCSEHVFENSYLFYRFKEDMANEEGHYPYKHVRNRSYGGVYTGAKPAITSPVMNVLRSVTKLFRIGGSGSSQNSEALKTSQFNVDSDMLVSPRELSGKKSTRRTPSFSGQHETPFKPQQKLDDPPTTGASRRSSIERKWSNSYTADRDRRRSTSEN